MIRTVNGSIEDVPSLVGGGYDLVVCHFVLKYRPDTSSDLHALVGALRPGGLLSLIAPNPADAVLAQIVRRGPAAALDELGTDTSVSATFDREVRKISDTQMRADLAAAGCQVLAQYGGRCANDLIADNNAKQDPEYYADLERLELALCDKEPFNRVGMFWQLIATVESSTDRMSRIQR